MRKVVPGRGFTLLEIVIALLVVAVLSIVGVVLYNNYTFRAQATDIVLKYDAIRAGVGTTLAQEQDVACEAVAKRFGDTNLKDQYARLAYGFEAVAGGYRPVLNVCAKADTHGMNGVKVARGAHDSLARNGRVEKGAVLTDTLVSFAAPLTDSSNPVCTVPLASIVTPCGDPVPTTPPVQVQPPTQVPPPAQAQPPVVQPPVVQPPVVQSPAVQPPAVQPPAVQPPEQAQPAMQSPSRPLNCSGGQVVAPDNRSCVCPSGTTLVGGTCKAVNSGPSGGQATCRTNCDARYPNRHPPGQWQHCVKACG